MADIKITGYAELAAPISTDLIEVVSDPGGTPISKKVQIRNLFKGGGQIAFPATAVPSADANTLDDYEEGTWTGVITDGTNNATMNANYTTGKYIRVGPFVAIFGDFRTTGLGSVSGAIRLTGLPFVNGNVAANKAGISVAYGGDLNITAGYNISALVEQNQIYFSLYIWDVATGVTTLTEAEWSTNGIMVIGGNYTTS